MLSPWTMATSLEHLTIPTNGIELHVVAAGPSDGPLAVLLHGFPELWYGWHRQIDALAGAGYRVLVPDQRGYNLSDKPTGVAAYRIDELARDVVGLISSQGRERALVAGHDWGAAVGWHLAQHHPHRIERMVLLNVPHPAVLARTLRTSREQQRKSWYIALFQLPWLPEWVASRQGAAFLEGSLRRTSQPGTFSDDDLAVYREAWQQPGAIRGMINWYRAALRLVGAPLPRTPIRVPVHLIWGKRDRFLGWQMARPSIERCAEGELTFLDDATHWLHHEQPERVSELMLEWFGPHR